MGGARCNDVPSADCFGHRFHHILARDVGDMYRNLCLRRLILDNALRFFECLLRSPKDVNLCSPCLRERSRNLAPNSRASTCHYNCLARLRQLRPSRINSLVRIVAPLNNRCWNRRLLFERLEVRTRIFSLCRSGIGIWFFGDRRLTTYASSTGQDADILHLRLATLFMYTRPPALQIQHNARPFRVFSI